MEATDERVMQLVAADGKIHLGAIDRIGARIEKSPDAANGGRGIRSHQGHRRPPRHFFIAMMQRGLIEQKEGFGARAVVHDHYELDPAAGAAALESSGVLQ